MTALVTAHRPLPPEPPARSAWRRAAVLVWRLAGAGALVWVVAAGWPQLHAAAAAVRDADAALLAAAIVCELAGLALLSGVWRNGLASAGAPVPLGTAAGVALRAGAVSRLLPGGGAAAGLFAVQRLRRDGVADGAAVTGVALASVTSLVTMALGVTAVGVRGGAPTVGAPWLVPVAAAVALAAVATALRSGPVRSGLRRLAQRLRARGVTGVWVATLDTLAANRPRRRDLLATTACAVGAWACELAALALALAAVAEPLPLPAVALGLGAAHAAAAIPHTPGGVGVVEVAMTAAFAAAGLDTAAALGAVLAYRLVGFWLPVALGAALLGADWLRVPADGRAGGEALLWRRAAR